MTKKSIHLRNVAFSYEGMTAPLLDALTLSFPVGWTGIVGPNGSGKTTVLRLAVGELTPQSGSVTGASNAIYCSQRTDDPPDVLDDLIRASDTEACRIRGRLGIEPDWPSRWVTLSHGERKRAQIAVALWRDPGVLAVDEPTNHLDAAARDLLAEALHAFRGVGLLVSHDRELLDALCDRCLFVDPPSAVMRPGGYTRGTGQAEQDEAHVRRQYELARRASTGLRREVARRRGAAAGGEKRRSKRGLARGDSDGRDKINRAIVGGKDAARGKLLRQLSGRLKQAEQKRQAIKVKKSYDTGIWIQGECSKRGSLFCVEATSIPLGGAATLHVPSLTMLPDDRIALTGPNGAGKSTLIDRIVRDLDLPEERLVYIPQEVDLEATQDIMRQAHSLNDEQLGTMMTIVSRLGSRPARLLESEAVSPGEIRKVLLAVGIARAPHLIIMDEPTNHLDLPSIECLEQALSGCPCGLLLVSHDRRFLDALVSRHWRITPGGTSPDEFTLTDVM